MNLQTLGLVVVLLSTPALATPRLIDQEQRAREAVRHARLTLDLEALEDPRPALWLGRGLMAGGAGTVATGIGVAIGGVALFFDASELAQSVGKLVFGWVGASAVVVVGSLIFIAGAVVLIIGIMNHLRNVRADAVSEVKPSGQRLEAISLATAPDRPASMPTVPGVRPGSAFEVLRF